MIPFCVNFFGTKPSEKLSKLDRTHQATTVNEKKFFDRNLLSVNGYKMTICDNSTEK